MKGKNRILCYTFICAFLVQQLVFGSIASAAPYYNDLTETDNVLFLQSVKPKLIIDNFDSEEDVSKWNPGENINSIQCVTSILNNPGKTYDGTPCLEARPNQVKAYEWRTISKQFDEPIDLSKYGYIAFAFNSWGGLREGYFLKVRLFSNNDVYEARAKVSPDKWSNIGIYIEPWSNRNNITKIEFSFVVNYDLEGLNEGQPGYDYWDGYFQIDNLCAIDKLESDDRVKASSEQVNHRAANAFDKDVYSYYSSQLNDNENSVEWLSINYDYVKYGVNKIKIYSREKNIGFPKDFKLQYTEDGDNWMNIPNQTYTNYAAESRQLKTFDFSSNPVNAKGIRIYATKLGLDDSGSKYCLQISEMKEEQSLNKGSAVITPTAVTVSSELQGWEGNKLIDNNVNTTWSSQVHGDAGNEEYIIMDLGKIYPVNGIDLVPRVNGLCFPVDFQMLYSNDGKNFIQIPGQSYSAYTNPGNKLQSFVFSPVKLRYIKIYSSKLGSDGVNFYFQLNEIKVHEDYPFISDKSGYFNENLNNMWNMFGAVEDGTNAVYKFGNEPTYFDWVTTKIMWSNETQYKDDLKEKIKNIAMSSDGYVWSWSNQPRWPSGNSYHFGNNVNYINAVYKVISWENSLDFLSEVDDNTAAEGDASKGMTVGQKVDLAMKYVLEDLDGKNGLMIIKNDENNGKTGSHASNYWDNLLYGYKDGYTNIYFYKSLLSMNGIESMRGNDKEAKYYKQLAQKAKEKYNETFWDKEKGRYIANIDSAGVKRDFGFTFQNIEALANGLGDQGKANKIYSWLNGKRIIDGEKSTGSDIYDAFEVAPRSNTVPIESTGRPYWWNDCEGAISVEGNAKYGEHLENGGAIFYTSFYDVLARAKYLGANDAEKRFGSIIDEFSMDELRRDPVNSAGAPWVIGIINEFPESGLVPASYLYSFLGIDANKDGLQLYPNLPDDMNTAGVKDLAYNKTNYNINVTKGSDKKISKVEFETVNGSSLKALKCNIGNLSPNKHYTLTNYDISNNKITNSDLITDEDGTLKLSIDSSGNRKITLMCSE